MLSTESTRGILNEPTVDIDPEDLMARAGEGSGELSYRRLMLLELDLLRPRVDELPLVAAEAFAIADGYWTGGVGGPSDLDDSRVACWRYLDARMGSSTRVVGREAHLIRALICVLSPSEDSDAWGSAWCFADMLSGA